jgi:Zn-dependent M32 family carboxypeptidase
LESKPKELGARLVVDDLRSALAVPEWMLRGWLRETLYQHGREYAAPDVVERATGQPLNTEPHRCYLRCTYGTL